LEYYEFGKWKPRNRWKGQNTSRALQKEQSGGGEERDVGEGGELGGRDHSRQIFGGVEDTKKNLGLADHSRCIWVVGKG